MNHNRANPTLKRAIGLPLLVFYGLEVTVGAGIFATAYCLLPTAYCHSLFTIR